MRRKSHVSFLGEDATVTSRPYPTNGTRQGMASVCWAIMDTAPPADRRGPPRSEILAEQGKPVVLPATAGEPQRTLLVLREGLRKKRTPSESEPNCGRSIHAARVDQNNTVTDSELKTSIRVSGARRPVKIMDLRVAH